MTDQHQTAAVAPRLSEDDEAALRKLLTEISPGPWFFNSYSLVCSAPLVQADDDAPNHPETPRPGPPFFTDEDNAWLAQRQAAYEADPCIAWVPAHYGDTATGRHAADAEFIEVVRRVVPDLLITLDATRADLARTRAEAAALRAERDDARRWAVRLEQRLAAETAAAYRLLLEKAPPWFAAPQSEQPPVAPVAPRGVACPKCGGDAFASFDVIVGRGCGHVIGATTPPVAPSAEAKVTDHVFVRRVCCERCAFWWQVESKRTYCERPYEEHAGSRPATTPPDHQAGDER